MAVVKKLLLLRRIIEQPLNTVFVFCRAYFTGKKVMNGALYLPAGALSGPGGIPTINGGYYENGLLQTVNVAAYQRQPLSMHNGSAYFGHLPLCYFMHHPMAVPSYMRILK